MGDWSVDIEYKRLKYVWGLWNYSEVLKNCGVYEWSWCVVRVCVDEDSTRNVFLNLGLIMGIKVTCVIE